MISGLKVKHHKNGEIAALFTPGNGHKRARWRPRQRSQPRCLPLAHVYLWMDAAEIISSYNPPF